MNGSTIKRLREAKHMTQQDLAVASGLHVATISRLELDKHPPHLRTLQVIADGLGMELENLLAEARRDMEQQSEPAGKAVGS